MSVAEALADRCSLIIESRPKRRGHRFFGITHLPHHRTMNLFCKRRFIKRIFFGTFIVALVIFIFVFLGIPLIFRYSYVMQRSLLFLNFVKVPNVNYNKPASVGLVGARNLYIASKDDVKLGTWHMLPANRQLEALAHNWLSGETTSLHQQYDSWLRDGAVVIYCHGNAGTRASEHRVELYKLLNQLNYHVIAFDYRGYADSSKVVTDEQGVVEDTKAVINWVKSRAPENRIFVWGHSLGTAVASHTLAEMEMEGKNVKGIVLEAPFNNLSDEIREYPISKVFRFLPWFEFFFVDPVYENNLRFESDVNLLNVTAPILFLHAKDDPVVPYKLGHKLYETVLRHRKDDKSVEFVSFDSNLHLGHKFICRDKRLPSIVRKFVESTMKKD